MRDAEVHYVDAILRVQHDVLRFQIAVNHASGVCGFERAANLGDDSNGLFGRKFFSFPEYDAKVAALDVLHGDELEALGLSQVENANDIAVGNFPDRGKLPVEQPEA